MSAGAIAAAVASQQDYTGAGGVAAKSIVASGGTQLIKPGPGRLMRILVTVLGAQGWTFYDSANVGSPSGTIVAAIPASAALGTIYDLRMPVVNGIVAVPSASGVSQLTVSFS